MGIMNRLTREKRDLSLTNDKAWNPSLWNLAGSQSLSGETVTEFTALNNSAVYNAQSLISGTIGSLPLHLMRKEGKLKKIADQKPLYGVMHDRWNPYMTAMAGRELLQSHALMWGNGYAEKVFDNLGRIVELWPIPPNKVVKIKMQDGKLVYDIMVGSEVKTFPREKILHIPGLGFDGFQGYSIIALARKSIGLGMAMETFGSTYFGQGTHPGVIVSHPGKLDPARQADMKESLMTTYSGLGKSHRLMLLQDGMKIENIGIPPNDSQFLESRQFQIPEIARWFNLPPHKLKDLTKSSFSNIEQEQISFVTDSILPWCIRFEQNYNMQLLTLKEYSQEKLYFKHILEGLLRGDAASRSAFYASMFIVGAMSVNEIRAKEDMDPVDGGDIHLVPMNMMPLEDVGKEPESPKITEGKDNADEETDEVPSK